MCNQQGMHLCSLSELQTNACCFRGCSLDNAMVWTRNNGCSSAGERLPPLNANENSCAPNWLERSKLSSCARPKSAHCPAVRAPNRSRALVPRRILFNLQLQDASSHRRAKCAEVNTNRVRRLHPGWEFVSDDDASCLVKMRALGLPERVLTWYRLNKQRLHNRGAFGTFMSDLCKMTQLFSDGGIYLDNDVYLLEPLHRFILPYEISFTVGLPKENGFYTAFYAAAAGHDAICRGLRIQAEHLCAKRSPFQYRGIFGPATAGDGFDEAYCTKASTTQSLSQLDRDALRKLGANALRQELRGPGDIVVTADGTEGSGGQHVDLESRKRGKQSISKVDLESRKRGKQSISNCRARERVKRLRG